MTTAWPPERNLHSQHQGRRTTTNTIINTAAILALTGLAALSLAGGSDRITRAQASVSSSLGTRLGDSQLDAARAASPGRRGWRYLHLTRPRPVRTLHGAGVDWRDLGIGASAGAGIALLLAGALLLLRHGERTGKATRS